MIRWQRWTPFVALIVIFAFAFPPKAYAYLDPGSGSLLLQVVAAALLAVLYTMGRFRKSIKAFFVNLISNLIPNGHEPKGPDEHKTAQGHR